MKKWKKILISLITVFVLAMLPAESAILPGTVCVTEAAPRISSSKLTDPYEILTQKDASEIANDTLDMAVPYWADLLKGSGITLRSLGFSTAAMALTDNSISIEDTALANAEKLAIVLGSEGNGLCEETIAHCDYTARIPMYHGVDSLNVAAAGAVIFWQLRAREKN